MAVDRLSCRVRFQRLDLQWSTTVKSVLLLVIREQEPRTNDREPVSSRVRRHRLRSVAPSMLVVALCAGCGGASSSLHSGNAVIEEPTTAAMPTAAVPAGGSQPVGASPAAADGAAAANGVAVLSWIASTEPDLQGYRVYLIKDATSVTPSLTLGVDVGRVTSYTLRALTSGSPYSVAVTAYDRSGNESVLSQSVSWVVK
jgi:hypothetical protein